MTDLKLCPFCGGEAVFRETCIGKYQEYRTIDFIIECGKCNASPIKGDNRISVKLTERGELCFLQDDRDRAAKAWNRRANND